MTTPEDHPTPKATRRPTPDSDGAAPPDARATLHYGEPEVMGDQTVRVSARDGLGNHMTVNAPTRDAAQAALRAAFDALHGTP